MKLPATPFTQPAQEAWLVAARKGETWGLEQLYRAYQPMVYALCERMLGCPHDAQDAMQATFIQAFRSLPRFRGQSSVKTWLYRIAVNEVKLLRRRSRRLPVALDVNEMTTDAPDAPDIAEQIVVWTALDGISQDHRTILVLRYWEELSYQDLAAVLKISMPAVKMRLKRAKAEFARRYKESRC